MSFLIPIRVVDKMFGVQFYPTPERIVSEMIGGYAANISENGIGSVLDPSAGKGDLLAPFRRYSVNKYGIEIDLKLCSILRDNHVTVLGHDFLKYDGGHRFDLVVMNPPFRNGVEHLLHAWEVCEGAEICCLLPKVMLDCRNGKERVLSNLIDDFGEVVDLGSCFIGEDVERQANVEVCKITLRRHVVANSTVFDFAPYQNDTVGPRVPIDAEAGIVKHDAIASISNQCRQASAAFSDMITAMAKMKAAIGTLISNYDLGQMVSESFKNFDGNTNTFWNSFMERLYGSCWKSLFEDSKFREFMTSGARRDFDKFSKDNGMLAFNEENITFVFESLLSSRAIILQSNIEEVFDYLTRYHDENRYHPEGWKTNDRWMVKQKFILPYIVDVQSYTGWHEYGWRGYQNLDDIDIAMCSASGKRLEDIKSIRSALKEGCKQADELGHWPDGNESEFFRIRCFKKGTGHFWFKDEKEWELFNRKACESKKWLSGEAR